MQTTLRIGGVPEHFNLPWRLAVDRVFAALSLQAAIDAAQAARTNLWHRSARRRGSRPR